jgi:23S rRNA (guanosine2251-2'-O)-methyltransferase
MKGEPVFGVNPVKEALRGTRRVFELYVQSSATDHRLEKIVKLAEERGIPVHRRERDDLTRFCASTHHQGVVLTVEPFRYADISGLTERIDRAGHPGFILALDGIQDPHNLGALIRSAACAGCDGVIIPKDRAAGITPAVERASAGAVETIAVARVTNMAQALQTLKESGFWVYGLAGGEGTPLHEAGFSGKTVLLVGNEGEGIRPLVRKQCDVMLSIPLYGGVGSLNASVAGGIALFEAARTIRGAAHVKQEALERRVLQ